MLEGEAKFRLLAGELQGYLNKLDSLDKRMVLVRGNGPIRYAQPTAESFDEQLARAQRSKDGHGVTRGLLNAASVGCGLIFSGKEVREIQAEVTLTSKSSTASIITRVANAKKAVSKAEAAVKAATENAKIAKLESDRAQADLEREKARLPSVHQPPASGHFVAAAGPLQTPSTPSLTIGVDSPSCGPVLPLPPSRKRVADEPCEASLRKRAMQQTTQKTKTTAKTLNRLVHIRTAAEKKLAAAQRQLHERQIEQTQIMKTKVKRQQALKQIQPAAALAGFRAASVPGC